MNLIRPAVCLNVLRNSMKTLSQKNNIGRILLASSSSNIQLPQRKNFATTTVDDSGIFKRLFKGFGDGNTKSQMRATSVVLYECVADNVNYAEFFQTFDLPDTFNSWFLVTEFHVWMLLMRVMNEGSESGEDGRFMRNCVVEAMWADVTQRARKLGADNPSFTRAQIAVLSEQFQATLISYDEGISSDDKILASALWRRFFSLKCEDYSKLEQLVKYTRNQTQQLDKITREELLSNPQIEWISLTE
ncbi:unnamed protein product [Diamesa hyperborea]